MTIYVSVEYNNGGLTDPRFSIIGKPISNVTEEVL